MTVKEIIDIGLFLMDAAEERGHVPCVNTREIDVEMVVPDLGFEHMRVSIHCLY